MTTTAILIAMLIALQLIALRVLFIVADKKTSVTHVRHIHDDRVEQHYKELMTLRGRRCKDKKRIAALIERVLAREMQLGQMVDAHNREFLEHESWQRRAEVAERNLAAIRTQKEREAGGDWWKGFLQRCSFDRYTSGIDLEIRSLLEAADRLHDDVVNARDLADPVASVQEALDGVELHGRLEK